MACLFCNKLHKEAITNSLCQHSFCRKCLYEKHYNGGVSSCPICDITLHCVSIDKLRPEQNLHDMKSNISPSKRRKIELPEVSPSLLGSTPIVSIPVAPILPPPTEKVSAKGEILAIDWHNSSAMKRKRLQFDATNLIGSMKEDDHPPRWNLSTEGVKILLDIACHLVRSTVPHSLSQELMRKQLYEIFEWINFHFGNVSSHQLEDTEFSKQEMADKEASCMKKCVLYEQKSSNLNSEHDAKLRELADFYEFKLKEQAQHYEAKVILLENKMIEKTKELLDQKNQLEQLKEAIGKKNKSIEMSKETTPTLDARESESVLEDRAKIIPVFQEESYSFRAGMEEGVKRAVRAVHSSVSYVNWDCIHLSENTSDEDRKALQRAFLEGIITAQPLVNQAEDQGRVIIF